MSGFEVGYVADLNLRLAIDMCPAHACPPCALSTIIDSTPTHRCSDLVQLLDGLGVHHWTLPEGVVFDGIGLNWATRDAGLAALWASPSS